MVKKYDSVRAAQELHQVLPRLERALRRVDRHVGATGAQLAAIAAISVFGKDRVGALAAHEGVSRPTMTRIVESLVTHGWVEKAVNEEDRRTPILRVTTQGQQVLVQGCEQRTASLVELLSNLSDDEWTAVGKAAHALHKAFGYRSDSSDTS